MRHIPIFSFSTLVMLFLLLSWTVPNFCYSVSSEIKSSKGQTVYVPSYSNVFTGPRMLPFQLATTLSIRNTDMSSSFQVTAIDYYNTSGKLIRRYLEKPFLVGPLASYFVHIEEKDTSGGFGANFIVKWSSGRVMNTPIIECVMIGATSGQGISFVSASQEIKETIR